MQRIALGFVGDYSCQDMIRVSKVAEGLGYDSIWVSEDLTFRDAIAPLASIALSTERIKLATGILPIYYRTPTLTAMTVATLDELSKGRMILGVGNGVRRWVEQQEMEFKEPLVAMEEYVDITRRLLAGKPVTYKGRIYGLGGLRLNFKLLRRRILVYVAARGPKMFQLAGKIADGALMSDGVCATSYIKWALENLKAGAERIGRRAHDVDLASFVILSVSQNHDKAKENVKPAVIDLLVGGSFDPYLEMMGLSLKEITPCRDAWRKGNLAEACARISDTVLDACAIYGTPNECAGKMGEFRSAGVQLPVIIPAGSDIEGTIESAKNW